MAMDGDGIGDARATVAGPVRISADYQSVRKLGHWTTASRFEVRAHLGSVTLDLRSPRIEGRDIEVLLDIDQSSVKLLVPANSPVRSEVRRTGWSKFRDWTGHGSPEGRPIVLCGQMRNADVRVLRGGMAILSAMFTREYVDDMLQAHEEGRLPVIDDPERGGY